jgi:uncharacterized protein
MTRVHRVLSRIEKTHLRRLIEELERETGVEVAVLVTPRVDDVDRFATTYFDHLGVGKREHDNGILILVVMDRRAVRIEVGRGLASVITPDAAQSIIAHSMVPLFRGGRYGDGLLRAVEALGRLVRAARSAINEAR